jgi:hypothetical protein
MTNTSQKFVSVDDVGMVTTLFLWWLMSLVTVWATTIGTQWAPLMEMLEAVRSVIPAVAKYGSVTEFPAQVAAFYCYFLLTSPLAVVCYFRFVHVRDALTRNAKAILWILVIFAPLALTVGVDAEPTETKGFARLFNVVLTSSWFGSSMIYLLFYHCLLFPVVCIAKNRRK